MRPIQPPDEQLRQSLAKILGAAAFDTAYTEGQHLPAAQALQLVRSDSTSLPTTAARP